MNRVLVTVAGFKGWQGTQHLRLNPLYKHCCRAFAKPVNKALVEDLCSRHLKLGSFRTSMAPFLYSGICPPSHSRKHFKASWACSRLAPKGMIWVGAANWYPSILRTMESTCCEATTAQSKQRFRTQDVFLDVKSVMNEAAFIKIREQNSVAVLEPNPRWSLRPIWASLSSSFVDTYPPPRAWNLWTKACDSDEFPVLLDFARKGWYLVCRLGWGHSEMRFFSIPNSAACETMWTNLINIRRNTLHWPKAESKRTRSMAANRWDTWISLAIELSSGSLRSNLTGVHSKIWNNRLRFYFFSETVPSVVLKMLKDQGLERM